MKRSEFESSSEAYWRKAQSDGVVLGGTVRCLMLRDVYAAERAGVTWDPEDEPVEGPVEERLAKLEKLVRLDGGWNKREIDKLKDRVKHLESRL